MGTTQTAIYLIANADTWMEDSAIEQLKRTAQLPGMTAVAGMPDLHPGRGYPVGAAFQSQDIFYPALVGNDIGCGMALHQLDLPKQKWGGVKLAEKLGNIDGPLDDAFQDAIDHAKMTNHPHVRALGTIGGGNHFAEIQQVDKIFVDQEELALHAPWLDVKKLQLLVHSGSRGLGEEILRHHVDQYGHTGLTHGSPEAQAYMQQHDAALEFARLNRQFIAERILKRLRTTAVQGLDIHHNYVERIIQDKTVQYLHRKGATPANQGIVMIPGSRGDYSYLVKPLPSEKSLYSLAHGAGRKWMRSDCIGKLGSRVRFDDLVKTSLGSTVVCNDAKLMFEEAPQAYKAIDSVVASMQEAGLMITLARFKPLMTYKTSTSRNSARKGCPSCL